MRRPWWHPSSPPGVVILVASLCGKASSLSIFIALEVVGKVLREGYNKFREEGIQQSLGTPLLLRSLVRTAGPVGEGLAEVLIEGQAEGSDQ